MTRQSYAPATLSPRKSSPPVPTEEEAKWALNPGWTYLEEIDTLPCRDSQPVSSKQWTSHYTDYAISASTHAECTYKFLNPLLS